MNRDHPVCVEFAACLRGFRAALASVFFASGNLAAAGAVAALCLAPKFALCAMLGLAAAWVAGRSYGFSRAQLSDGEWLRGAMLTSLAAAWIAAYWQWTPVKWISGACGAGILGCAISAALASFFRKSLSLPVLSAGFVAAATCLWMIFGGDLLADPSVLPASAMLNEPTWFPPLFTSFARSFGMVFFLPHAVAGLAILLAVGLRSRLALLAAFSGWAGGMAADSVLHYLAPWLPAAGDFIYNSTLCGLAIAGCFFIPSWRSLLLSAATGALAMTCWHAFAASCTHGSPARLFPVPFLISTWTVLACARLRPGASGLVPSDDPATRPEDALRSRREHVLRDPGEGLPALRPPFDGERVVTQGEDGPHTHRGLWQHALDFEIRDASGAPAPPGARSIEDYYTYRSPVFSPASGWVARVEDDVDDNPPGHHNLEQNWGNYVILRLESGKHIMLAHFLRRGLAVIPGQYVTVGAFLGSCGNSGRSPLPHLHLHCQDSAQTGAPTTPFRLAPWVEHLAAERHWHATGMPLVGTRVSAFTPDPWAARLFQSWRNGKTRYRIEPPSGKPRNVVMETGFTDDGRWRFDVPEEHATCYGSVESGALCLRGCRTRRHGLMSWMCLALARVPFTRDLGLQWSESLPSPAAPPWRPMLLPPLVITTRSRIISLRGEADRLDSITLRVEWSDRRSRGALEAELSPFRGLTRLVARTPAGTWHIMSDDTNHPV